MRAKSEQVTPLPSDALGALPSWVPAGFDLRVAAAGVKQLLEQRHVSVARVHELVITDADQTLLDTDASAMLCDPRSGELAKDPVTGETLRLGSDLDADRAALEKRFPQLPWSHLVYDYREFADAEALLSSPLIGVTADSLREQAANTDERTFLLTARNQPPALEALRQLNHDDRFGLDDVLSATSDPELEALNLADAPPGTPHGKALMMAALIELYRPKHAEIDHVTFYDDTDVNLAAAKELLPQLFPNTRFDFIDIVKQPDGSYVHVPR